MSRVNVSTIKTGYRAAPKRALCILGFSLVMTTAAAQVFAGCEYTITNQWNNGFTASVKVTNSGNATVNNWNVNWQYSSDNRITNSWNATLTGSNPYAATGLSWNSTLAPNQSAEFGFQGTKGSAAAELPKITGALCNATTSSVASSAVISSKSSVKSSSSIASSSVTSVATSVASSVASSVVISSTPRSSSSSSVAVISSSSSVNSSAINVANWNLDAAASYLNFVTTKNTHTVEVQQFTTISGGITAGVATLSIDLNSVNTGIALRDQRMRDLLFQTTNYPTATVTINLPANLLSGIAVGNTSEIELPATLDLHGVSGALQARVSVQKLSNARVLVQSLSPVLIKAADYSLTSGVEALRAAVGIASISAAVPVDFALVFEAR